MKKIMVADDDPAIVEAVSMILEIGGYDVCTTCDGKTVSEMREELPDLLLLDIWMSGEDGREICKRLKAQEKTKHIPIILISASKDIKKSAEAAGADDFIPKPFDMDELLNKVATYVSH